MSYPVLPPEAGSVPPDTAAVTDSRPAGTQGQDVTKAPTGPQIGDLVKDNDGHELVVTDVHSGQLIVRPLHSNRELPADSPEALTVVARRGQWGGRPGEEWAR
jgi:hypothetical protein